MAGRAKKCPPCPEGAAEWLLTYGDMVTLILTFFVLLYAMTPQVDPTQFQLILAAYQGLGNLDGGNTLSEGKLAEMGNTVNSLPAMASGRSLAQARKTAISLFEPEIRRKEVRVEVDERGLVISLASDSFFASGSAQLKREEARETIRKLAQLLGSEALVGKNVRFEGHTDTDPTGPGSKWPSNWELAAERAINTMEYTLEYVPDPMLEKYFSAATYGQQRPLRDNSTEDGKAFNRRVDVIILSDGHY